MELDSATGEIIGKPEYATSGSIQIEISCEDTKFQPPQNVLYFTLEFNIEDVEQDSRTPNFADIYNVYDISSRDKALHPTSPSSNTSPDFSSLVDLSYKLKREDCIYIYLIV